MEENGTTTTTTDIWDLAKVKECASTHVEPNSTYSEKKISTRCMSVDTDIT
jgi:hypothetical protein